MGEAATCSKTYQEFVKFGKFFTTRMVQAVVQARLGHLKVQSCSVQADPADWFSVRIDELGEIAAHMRTSVTKYPPNAECFTLDFLLHTADGDILPLESWSIRFVSDLIDASTNVRSELYHQLGTLLKSAMVCSRMTPTYRYFVRKQSPDTFIIMYRVCEKEPEMDLGEEQKTYRLGTVASPFGGFCFDLSYRTKMEITRSTRKLSVASPLSRSEVQLAADAAGETQVRIPFGAVPASGGAMGTISPVSDPISSFSVSPAEQSNELISGTSPRHVHFLLGRSRSSSGDSGSRLNTTSGSGEETIFGFDHGPGLPFSSSLPYQMPGTLRIAKRHSFPFSTLLTTSMQDMHSSDQLHGVSEDNGSVTSTSLIPAAETACLEGRSLPVEHSSLFPSRMHQCATVPSDVHLMSTTKDSKEKESIEGETEGEAASEDDEGLSSDESYVKVAFGSSENVTDGLGEFIKQCRHAPTHLAFQTDSTSVIPDLLAQFESNQKFFDNFVDEIKRKAQSEDD